MKKMQLVVRFARAGSYGLGSVCLSTCSSVYTNCTFLRIHSLVFLDIVLDEVREPLGFKRDSLIFGENLYFSKVGKMDQKQGFLESLENFKIKLTSKLKLLFTRSNILYFSVQSPYLGKF